MPSNKVRTRFAPSPTGYMHVGNLRTALYTYLMAKHEDGTFILRIEDTDQGRYVEGAVDVIYNTLRETGLLWDEGPDVGGPVGPYVQSQRMGMFKQYAEQLVKATGMRSSEIEGKDNAEICLYLIQRWEDEDGNVYARRIGTGYCKFSESVPEWQNGFRIPIYYGDISEEPFFRPEMMLELPDGPRYTTNSKGKNVPIQVVGWGDADAEPTHLMLRISSGDRGAFIGAVGTCFWIDNVSLVY